MRSLLVLLLGLGACASTGGSGAFRPVADSEIARLPVATDSQVVDVADGATIVLMPTVVQKVIGARSVAMYGYNGQIPGPLLRVRQGSTFTVDITNALPQPTSVHWHGVRLANANDGVVGVTQEAIAPGGAFRYTVTVPDEGMFWYHPHVREDIQQDLGLYGNLHVLPKDETAYAPVTATETLFLDDIAVASDGALLPYGETDATHALMGRFGNTLFLNGEAQYSRDVEAGSVVRFYLTNAANTRTFRWSIEGARMKLVASDIGRLTQERYVDSVTLAPAERATVDVLFPSAGTYRMRHVGPTVRELGTITARGAAIDTAPAVAFAALRTDDSVRGALEPLLPLFDKAVDYELRLTADVDGMQQMGHGMHGGMMPPPPDGIEWEESMAAMNAASTRENTRWKIIDAASGSENEQIVYSFKRGDIARLRIVNDPAGGHAMQHPIHLHGQRFLVISTDGRPSTDLGWKDTVLVPQGATVDILVEMSNPGSWMLHCHIAEHLTNGMMAMFEVGP